MEKHKNIQEIDNSKEVIDSLCLPDLYIGVYMAENGKRWVDSDNITPLRTFAFNTTCKGCPLVGVFRFHPLRKSETDYQGE